MTAEAISLFLLPLTFVGSVAAIGILLVLLAGRSGKQARATRAALIGISLAILSVLFTGPDTGTAGCAAGLFGEGAIAALALGFGLYAFRRMRRGERGLPFTCAIFSLLAVAFVLGRVFSETFARAVNRMIIACW